MNERKPDWYRLLHGDPVRRRTFTPAMMERIEQLAEQLQRRSRRHKAGRRNVLAAVVASTAVVILIAVGFVLGGHERGRLSDIVPPADAPSMLAESTDKPIPSADSTQHPGEGDIRITVDTYSGKLGDRLPFRTEDVQRISFYTEESGGGGQDAAIPKERQFVLLTSLKWLDLSHAKADEAARPDAAAVLRFHLKDKVYALHYDIGRNTYDLGGARFYADDQVALLMNGLMRPGTPLAELDRTIEHARMTFQQTADSVDESFSYSSDRLRVEGKDFIEWEAKLLLQSSGFEWEVPYYDAFTEKAGVIRPYEQGGILHLSRLIVFTSDRFATKDGVKVGLTGQDVVDKLGKPNLKTGDQWSYKIGDYLMFSLYFEENHVKYIALSQPL